MRDVFDDWLNDVAQKHGATFWDQTKFLSFEQKESHIRVILEKGTEEDTNKKIVLNTDYLIDATGLRPVIRKKMRPEDFENQTTGATLSYYVEPSTTPLLKPNILYQFWDVEFNDVMFAWVYVKTLEDGEDYWVVGTGCLEGNVKKRQEKFFNFIQEKYNLRGDIVKTEAYASNVTMTSENKIWLGEENILMVGDAAGFVDPVRGVGMDAAALSARFAADAIVSAKHEGGNALEVYKGLVSRTVEQTRKNQERGINHFDSNDELDAYMKRTMLKRGVGLIVQSFLNKFRSVENLALLPP